jgi:hypothetical protein
MCGKQFRTDEPAAWKRRRCTESGDATVKQFSSRAGTVSRIGTAYGPPIFDATVMGLRSRCVAVLIAPKSW